MDEEMKQFLRLMKVPEDSFDKLSPAFWFTACGIQPDKVRFAIKSIEKPIVFRDWAAITISAGQFFELSEALPNVVKEILYKSR